MVGDDAKLAGEEGNSKPSSSPKEGRGEAGLVHDASGTVSQVFGSPELFFNVVSFLDAATRICLPAVSRSVCRFIETHGESLWQQLCTDKWFSKGCRRTTITASSNLRFRDAYMLLAQNDHLCRTDSTSLHCGSVSANITFSDESPVEDWEVDSEGYIRYLQPYVDLNRAIVLDRCLTLSPEKTIIVQKLNDTAYSLLRACCAYFEVEVKKCSTPPGGEFNDYPCLTIGYAAIDAKLGRLMPGWSRRQESFGWHSDDGLFFFRGLRPYPINAARSVTFGVGDRVGAGMYRTRSEGRANVAVFFTKNGQLVSDHLKLALNEALWSLFQPCVGFDTFDHVRFHFDSVQFDIGAFIHDNALLTVDV